MTNKTYLISHANSDGHSGIAQTQIEAKSEALAREEFAVRFPNRVITTIYEKR